MLRAKKYRLLAVLSLFLYCHCFAQPSTPGDNNAQIHHTSLSAEDSTRYSQPLFVVRNIILRGNKKTKDNIILREIPFKTGEAYALNSLVEKFEDARRQLMNLTLFHEVMVALKSFEGYNVDVVVEVRERWYLFPIPYVKAVDNFNTWRGEHDFSLDRINYGVKLMYKNATGRNDNLNVKLINGYTKQISFNYDRMYIDKAMKWGMGLKFDMGKNHEINYNTINDKLVGLKDPENYIRSFMRANVELTYRRAIKTRHRFGIGYIEEKVQDTVVALNPGYFPDGRNRIRFPEFYYNMGYYDLDYIPYPLIGYAAEVNLSKKGLNNIMNMWQLIVRGSGSWPVIPKTYFNLRAGAQIKLPFKQPYFNKRLMGGSDLFMQGFENYTIDGVAGGYLKAIFIREIFNFNVHIPSKKFTAMNNIPFRIFAKLYGNAGYVHNPEPGTNTLTNKMLYTGGFGVDIVTFYDLILKLEWSFNPLGQNNIYLHQKSYF